MFSFVLRLLMVCLAFSCAHGMAATYPIKLTKNNGHILVDKNDVPFLLQGDCAWGLMVAPTQPEVDQYLENRRQKGFNTVVVMLVANHASISGHTTANHFFNEPFLPVGDLSRPNDAYFTNADWIIDRAALKGIQVLLAPLYVGYDPSQGWQDVMVANGTNNCRSYGRFVGQRYRNKPNIIWLHSGDNNDPAFFPFIREIALGIKEFDTNHLHTAKMWPENSARDFLGNESWLNLNTTYAYGLEDFFRRKVYDKTIEDFNVTPAMASFLVESTFEDEHGADAYIVRRQAYWSILGGSSGQVMGNARIWPFYAGWQTQMNGPASVSMSYLYPLVTSRPWYTMEPDQNHTVVTAGYGRFGFDDYLGVARATNGSFGMIYVPTARTFTVDMSRFSGQQVQAWWYSPRDGRATNAGTYAASGSRTFTPVDTYDWVLVIDDIARGFPAPVPLQVTTGVLPDGRLGAPYLAQFEAKGGIDPLSWSLAANSEPLPGWLSFSQKGMLDGTPTNAGTFRFTVEAADATGAKSSRRMRMFVDGMPPTSPSNLTAVAVSLSQINLSWVASTDGGGVTGYNVERCEGSGCTNFSKIATTTTTNYIDASLAPGIELGYRVQATDSAGNGSYSSIARTATWAVPIPAAGLVAAYAFNEGAGSTVADASGHGNTGNIVGASWTNQGRYAGGLLFNGSSLVTVSDSNSLDLTNGMTLEAWVSMSTSGGWTTAVLKEQSTDLSYALLAGSGSDNPGVYIYTAGQQSATTIPSLALNTWTHLAGTYNGSMLRLFVNGNQVATQLISAPIMASGGPLRIGGNAIWGEYFLGIIDEVRVYNRALSQSEIQSDLNRPIGAYPALSISAPSQSGQQIAQEGFRLNLASESPALYALEWTTNFSAWQLISSVICSNTPFQLIDPGAMEAPSRFYRGRQP